MKLIFSQPFQTRSGLYRWMQIKGNTTLSICFFVYKGNLREALIKARMLHKLGWKPIPPSLCWLSAPWMSILNDLGALRHSHLPGAPAPSCTRIRELSATEDRVRVGCSELRCVQISGWQLWLGTSSTNSIPLTLQLVRGSYLQNFFWVTNSLCSRVQF